MKKVIVLGDGAQTLVPSSNQVEKLTLSTFGIHQNVRCHVDIFRTKFLRDLPKRLNDLLLVATIVYVADTKITRGSKTDLFADKWTRDFHVVLPVWDFGFWNTTHIKELLCDTLNFLSGDTFSFKFVKKTSGDPFQGALQFKEPMEPYSEVDEVVLFSGGIDSLAATIESIQENCHPILVSHRSAPTIDRRQKNLVELLRSKFSNWIFPHVSMWVSRAGGGRSVEFSQRTRSFLFTSLGVTAAKMLDINSVKLCDNGIVSINLPQSGQTYSTLLSRSTHPRYIEKIQRLMQAITEDSSLSIINTLLFKTKKEVMEFLANSGHPDLLQETISCAHTEGKTRLQPHCGVCSQCIDRRFNSIASGLTQYDLVDRYEKDIFIDSLQEGEELTLAENYVRLALELEKVANPDQFFTAFPQLYDCLPMDGDVERFGDHIWELFQRHQKIVNNVVEKMIEKYSSNLRKGDLPNNCLLSVIGRAEHIVDPPIKYIKQLRTLLCDNIPTAFQSKSATNENEVQDIGETILKSAEENLKRESPQIPFSSVNTKPDFSNTGSEQPALFIEFKYPKTRNRLNNVITEMSSRVTIYRAQNAWVLFIVYDPNRVINDDNEFLQDFEKHEKIYVGICR